MYQPKPNDGTSTLGGFVIGTASNGPWVTSLAADHMNGRMTNERLFRMTDDELAAIAKGRNDGISVEEYRNAQGEVTVGVHRAKLILMFRLQKRLDESRERRQTEGDEKKTDEAIEAMRANFFARRNQVSA
jgi:hypothetical protein